MANSTKTNCAQPTFYSLCTSCFWWTTVGWAGLIKGPSNHGRGYTPTSDAYLIKAEDKDDAMAKLEFSIVPAERAADVAELLLSSFFKDEPLGIALGLPVSQASRWLPLYIKEAVKEGWSWMAVDTETDKLVGASINVVKHADPAANTLHMPDYIDAVAEPTMCTIAKFLGHLSSDVEIPGNPDRSLSILFLNVESHYGGRGIAQDLTRRSEQHAASNGINTFVVDTTSEFSYKVYKKLGYDTLTELAYADYADEGVRILEGKEMGPHTHARVLAKTLV